MPGQMLTPFHRRKAERVGARRYRKQVLPVGSIDYHGRRLDFSHDRLAQLKRATEASGLDQIPFVLANDANEHTDDPERFRGSVARWELEDDGLYAVLDLSKDGADLIEANPGLGISARIIEGFRKGSAEVGSVIEHVCGTLRPHVKGMGPWKEIALTSHSDAVSDPGLTTCLTEFSFSPPMDGLTQEDVAKLKGIADRLPEEGEAEFKFSDEDEEFFKQLLGSSDGTGDGDGEGSDGDGEGAGSEGEGTGDGEGEGTEAGAEKQPVAALSQEAKDAIELAQSTATAAQAEAARLRKAAAKSEWDRERAEYEREGVPPSMLNLAEPVLSSGREAAIELSDGENVDAAKAMREMLDAAKGTIDLTELGRDAGAAPDEVQDLADSWEKQEPMGARTRSSA